MLPFEFQKKGISWLLSKYQKGYPGLILGDEMGLGKTVQAAFVAKAILKCNTDAKVLIVCPKSVINSWISHVEEICKTPVKKFTYGFENDRVAVINYAMLDKHFNMLIRFNWAFLIFDEAHRLKNYTTKWTQIAFKLINQLYKNKGKLLLMSGTPMQNYVIEIYFLLKMCRAAFIKNKEFFEKKYCNARFRKKYGEIIYDNTGTSNEEEFKNKAANYMLRRMKEDELDLPPLTEQSIIFENARGSDDEKQFRECITLEDVRLKLSHTGEHFATRRREDAIRKLDKCVEYIKGVMLHKKKLVVFAYHREVIESLKEKLGKKFKVVTIVGGMSTKKRTDAIDQFQNGDAEIIIVNIKAGGEGITLTAADTNIIMEIDVTPGVMEQVKARSHRISQTKPVHIIYLFEDKTIDAHIVNILLHKQQNLRKVG